MKNIFLFVLIVFTANIYLFSVEDSASTPQKEISYTKLGILTGGTVGGFVWGQIAQQQKYWQYNSDFHVMSWRFEYDDALCADKFGHFFFANHFSQSYKNALLLTGLDSTTSLWLALGITFGFHTFVEINDGFSDGRTYLGFSRMDILADFSGVAFTYFQTKYPGVNKFNFKYSLQKSANFDKNGYGELTDDYESSYHWLAMDSRLIYDSGKDWQKYLNLAIGHSVKNIDRYGSGNHELYISLDYNLKEIDTGYELLNFLIKGINGYHFPAPAIRVYPSFKVYLFKL